MKRINKREKIKQPELSLNEQKKRYMAAIKDKMHKEVLNELIAIYFEFKKINGKNYLIGGNPQWIFPINFPLEQCSSPNVKIPDFIQMLIDYMEFKKIDSASSHYPKQWPKHE